MEESESVEESETEMRPGGPSDESLSSESEEESETGMRPGGPSDESLSSGDGPAGGGGGGDSDSLMVIEFLEEGSFGGAGGGDSESSESEVRMRLSVKLSLMPMRDGGPCEESESKM